MIPVNDWEIKKCLYLSLAILLVMLGLIGLAGLGFDIPGLRQIVGFIFLTFVPGILILRILKIHNIGIIESLLYSVGLSIALIMFSGLFMNLVFPLFGIVKPISTLPVVVTLTVISLILAATAYWRDRDFSALAQRRPAGTLSRSSLALVLLVGVVVLPAVGAVHEIHELLVEVAFLAYEGHQFARAVGRTVE